PVASVERILTPEENRGGNWRAPMHGDFHHEGITERASGFGKELPRQIWLMAMTQKSIAVERVNRVHGVLVEIASEARLEVNAGLGHATALALGLFAFVGSESLEITLEAGVVAVRPVELAVAAH